MLPQGTKEDLETQKSLMFSGSECSWHDGVPFSPLCPSEISHFDFVDFWGTIPLLVHSGHLTVRHGKIHHAINR